MLRIKRDQVQAFHAKALRSFEDEMVSHLRGFAPRRCGELDDERLLAAVRGGIDRSTAYGFTNRGPIRLFLESMLMFGAHFDTDPQYPALAAQLGSRDDQMLRAQCIYDEILAYRAAVLGKGGENLRRALAALIALTQSGGVRLEDEGASMLQALTSAFPEKAAYVGRDGLLDLIRRGRAEAIDYGVQGARAETTLVTAMFALGHGVSRDWSYPAVQQALTDVSLRGTGALAERLESTVLSLLQRTLADISKEAQR